MTSTSKKLRRPYQRAEVALGLMKVNPVAQREFKPARSSELLADLDLDMFSEPVLNWRSADLYHIVDGQHRVDALRRFLGEGWEKATVMCRVYKGMSDKEEADMFDRLNNVLTVSAFSKFNVRVTAQREDESAIASVITKEKLRISRNNAPGAVGAVGTLVRIYKRTDSDTLARTLRIVRDSFGDTGFEAVVIDGIGLLCQRYNGTLDEEVATARLGSIRGGVNGLLGKAHLLHKQTHSSLSKCVAAAAVDIINAHRGAKKLPSWWSSTKTGAKGATA